MESASLTKYPNLDPVLKELDFSDDPIAPLELSLAATALSESEPAEDNGVPLFEHLRIRNPRVCHVRVHSALAMPCRARTRSSCDCLVVTELAIAEGQVIHAALTRCTGTEGFQDHVCDALRGQYVASHYCCLR